MDIKIVALALQLGRHIKEQPALGFQMVVARPRGNRRYFFSARKHRAVIFVSDPAQWLLRPILGRSPAPGTNPGAHQYMYLRTVSGALFSELQSSIKSTKRNHAVPLRVHCGRLERACCLVERSRRSEEHPDSQYPVNESSNIHMCLQFRCYSDRSMFFSRLFGIMLNHQSIASFRTSRSFNSSVDLPASL